MRARQSLDSAVGQHLKTSSPLARRSSWKTIMGQRNDGDGLPATKGCEREDCPERNPCPAHSDRWSLVEEGSTPAWAAA
ncbi:hypothetical protein G5714_019847 [Onychostoma macrolepis]|uniref:Uncharacterized protein n=1 Tax=Onychostoma macrolepis TaxID=369639 RepID=A0A7J6BY58_9TELE|nr:hypothetical protein G5714_019847 [Onychostoma macrolepis]